MRQVDGVDNAPRRGYISLVTQAAATGAGAARSAADDEQRLTPAMRQWREQKEQAGDALLLFRMGDFYEMFYDDAVRGARLLGIALTSRDASGTPLAGIPHHALESYLLKLVQAGCKVAISEQIEDPKLAKGIVKRAIARVVTPGTLTDESLLQRSQSNLLAAVFRAGRDSGIAALELSTGQFHVRTCDEVRLMDELWRLQPAEVLLPESSEPVAGVRDTLEHEIRDRLAAAATYRPAADFAPYRAGQLLEEQFGTRGLEGFGFARVDAALQAAGALLAYVRETQKCTSQHIRPPRRQLDGEAMALDPTTLRSLEVERTLRTGAREGSLLDAVDHTCNPMGARLLRQWLCYPLRRVEAILARQRMVAALRADELRRGHLRHALREMGDIGRTIGRIGVQRTNPRDLRALGDGLKRLATMRADIEHLNAPESAALAERLVGLDALAERLTGALRVDAPLTVREGDIFAAGVDAELDRLRSIDRDGQRWLAEYQAGEVQRTGIPTLKVAYNRVFGFYIEITNPHRDRVPPDYVRRQTVKNAERYITDALKRHETDVLTAQTRANELEHELFTQLRDEVATHLDVLQRAAETLAELDVLAGWAELAVRRGYCRPEFVDESLLEIDDGRHPVVEQSHDGFVANDARLNGRERRSGNREPEPATGARGSLALITGPNMAGKSTYIRQVALLTLLAHCGCDVPARRMRLGIVDRIFTRVGASDELSRGQSTFMVEMIEAANILNNATPASLVILDEVGRGTSTYDGLALAWAISEHLATRVGCRALFATHYHELTELAELIDSVFNLNVAVREYEDQVVFLHRIVPGAAGRSYGLHVAKLAGIPRDVLERANAVLNELERSFSRESQRPVLAGVQRRRQRQLRLFEAPEEAVVRQLRELDAAALSPERAVEFIAAARRMLGMAEGGG